VDWHEIVFSDQRNVEDENKCSLLVNRGKKMLLQEKDLKGGG
jgi:hypothetical protein